MNRIKELKMLVEEKSKLEKELAGTKNFEDRVKLSYRIGGLLACIVLEGKNIFLIKEIDIVDREMQVKRIKNRIKAIKEQEGETEYLLDLYKQLGLKETWLFTVKNTRNKEEKFFEDKIEEYKIDLKQLRGYAKDLREQIDSLKFKTELSSYLLEVSEDQESYVEEFARIVNEAEEEIFEKLQILHLVGCIIIHMFTNR